MLRGKGLPGINNATFSRALNERYERFGRALRRYRGDLVAAREGLVEEFGDTYWYYYVFGESGASWRMSGRRTKR
jgi:hypothetical protein